MWARERRKNRTEQNRTEPEQLDSSGKKDDDAGERPEYAGISTGEGKPR